MKKMNNCNSYIHLLLVFSPLRLLTKREQTALEVHITVGFKPLKIIKILVTFQNKKLLMIQAMTSLRNKLAKYVTNGMISNPETIKS